MPKNFIKKKNIHNYKQNKFQYSNLEIVFLFHNLKCKIMSFKKYFYLYSQNLATWKKNNTNNMNMLEKG